MSSPHQRGVLEGNIIKWDSGGKKELTLNTKAINIIWGGEGSGGRYWRPKIINEDDDQVPDAVELLGAYWLEITGKVPHSLLSPGTTYKFSVLLQLKPEASGWDNAAVIFRVHSPGKTVPSSVAVDLTQYSAGEWVEVPDGGLEFFVPQDDDSGGILWFSIYEIGGGEWKKGLVIRQVNFSPKLPKPNIRTIM